MSIDLLGQLKGTNTSETIKALQYLIAKPKLATNKEITSCVEKLTASTEVGVRFWAKKVSNNLGSYQAKLIPPQVSNVSTDLPVDILIQKLQAINSSHISLSIIIKLCQSRKEEALTFLKTYLTNCKDNIQISYLTKNLGVYFPSEEMLLFLMPFLKSHDDRTVANTVEGIDAIGSPKGLVVLSQLLKQHNSNRVRTNAALAIRKFDSEKSFAIISKMLSPESDAHFRISACHAIKTLQDVKFLDLLEIALHEDLIFTAALDAIESIGGPKSIALLADNYSQFPSNKQFQIDKVAAKLSQLEENALKKLGVKVLSTNAAAKANLVISEYADKFRAKLRASRETLIKLFYPAFGAITILAIIIWTSYSAGSPSSISLLQDSKEPPRDKIGAFTPNPQKPRKKTKKLPRRIKRKRKKQYAQLKTHTSTKASNRGHQKIVYTHISQPKVTKQFPVKMRNTPPIQKTALPSNTINIRDCLNKLFGSENYTYAQREYLFNQNYKDRLCIVEGKIQDVGTYDGSHYITFRATSDNYVDVYTREQFNMMKYRSGQKVKFIGNWTKLGTGLVFNHQVTNAVEVPNQSNPSFSQPAQYKPHITHHAPAPTPSPSLKQTPLTKITWREFDNIFSISSRKSDFQKEALWKRKYKGREVSWTGEVKEVKQRDDCVGLLIRMNPDTFTFDVSVDLQPSQTDKAIEINKGQNVSFKGTLKSYGGAIIPTKIKNGIILD